VTLDIPARIVAEVGKQGANAHLALRLGKVVFRSAIFFVDRVVGLDGHGRKGFAAFRKFVTDGKIVSGVGDQQQENGGGNNPEKYVFQPFLPLIDVRSVQICGDGFVSSLCHENFAWG